MADLFCTVCNDTGDVNHEKHEYWERYDGRRLLEPCMRPCVDCPRCLCGVELARHEGYEDGAWGKDDVLRLIAPVIGAGARPVLVAPPCWLNAAGGRLAFVEKYAWFVCLLRIFGFDTVAARSRRYTNQWNSWRGFRGSMC